MEIENTSNESVTESTESSEVVTAEGSVSDSQESSDSQTPAYTPNFKYKVKDKELEFDPRIQSFIKDKDTEDYFRNVFTKHDAFDDIKSEREEFKTKYSDLEGKWNKANERLGEIFGLAKTDLGLFFKEFNVSEDAVIDFVKQYLENPEHVKSTQDLAYQNYQSQTQLKTLEAQNQEFMRQQHEFKLDQAMSKPEISSFEKRWDEMAGQGNFRSLVKQFGSNHFNSTGQYLEPGMAVMAVFNQYQKLIPSEQPVSQQITTPSQSNISNTSTSPTPPPNLGSGSNTAPIKRKFKNYDEMRKYNSMGSPF